MNYQQHLNFLNIMNKFIKWIKEWFTGLFMKGKVIQEKEKSEQEVVQEKKGIKFPTAKEATEQTYEGIDDEVRRKYVRDQIKIGIEIKKFCICLNPLYVTPTILKELEEAGYTIYPLQELEPVIIL